MVHLTTISDNLPKGWVWTQVKDIAKFIRGVSYRKNESSKTLKTDYTPILRANNISAELNYEDLVYVPREKVKDEQFVKALDIIIAMSSGSKHLVGKAAQAHQDFEGGFGTFCGLVRGSPQLDRKFIGLFFQSPGYRNEISSLSIGININNLRRENVESMLIPIPPLAEQRRIVAKLETLFAQLDAAVDSLKKAQVQLQQYRRSILKTAFEGELTRKGREGHSGKLEPMAVSKVSMQEGLPDLPDGWVWTEIKDTAEFIRGVSYRKNQSSKTPKTDYVPILRANNINGQLNYEDLVYVPREKVKDEQFVKALDIIIAMSSGSKHLVGKAAQAHQDFEGGFGTFCGLVRVSEEVNQKFIGLFFQSPIYRNEISRLSIGININNLRSANIEAMLIPLPPLTEQEQIVSELERYLSIADAVEARIASELLRAEHLRQSILKHAFSGKLVPQDPNDEPASVLLEKIRDEKKIQPKQQRKTKKSKMQDSDNYPLLALAGALEQNDDSINAASLVELRGDKGE